MRGISDIIAVVLMIAVAIAIGVFVTNFATKWVTDQTTSSSIACAIKTNYVIDDVKFNYSGKDELLVRITNKGDQAIHGFSFVLFNVTNIQTIASDSKLIINQVTSAKALQREQSAIMTLNFTNASTGSGELIGLAKSATKLTVRNDACEAVSASIDSVTVY
ncbi:MAG: hypothetical protein HY369_05495 [Candidatus Aenigmarchaeota archaeon]|nr:hypothetical protein [Candidatus Aenigmarchaeota archaeon]